MFAGAIAGASTGVVLVVVGLIGFSILLFRRRAPLATANPESPAVGSASSHESWWPSWLVRQRLSSTEERPLPPPLPAINEDERTKRHLSAQRLLPMDAGSNPFLIVPTLADTDIVAYRGVEPDSNERAHPPASLLDETAPAPALRFRARGSSSARARARAGDALALADGGKANAVTASAGTVRGGKGTTRPKRARTPLADDDALPAV
jgi:hypothetical protein